MSKSVNEVTLIGNLGQEPEMKYTQNGRPLCRIRLATTDSWTDQHGEKKERTEWHSIVVWGKLAEICGQHLHKGSRAYFKGKLQTRSYEKDGSTRYTTEINASDMMMLGGKRDGGGGYERNDYRDNQGGYSRGQHTAYRPSADEDVPF